MITPKGSRRGSRELFRELPTFPRRRTQSVGLILCWDRILRNSDGQKADGWRFPRKIEKALKALTNASTLHFFGGKASWGRRLDIDASLHPDILGDAFLAPLGRDTFDFVVIDPPYDELRNDARLQLFEHAAWIARRKVFWWHTFWCNGGSPLVFERGWLVRLAGNSRVRALQQFRPREPKKKPRVIVQKTPKRKYNGWRFPSLELPFPPAETHRI